jgi:hypothetical protein
MFALYRRIPFTATNGKLCYRRTLWCYVEYAKIALELVTEDGSIIARRVS